MYRCSEKCLNFDDETNKCILGHQMFFNKKNGEYIVKNCKDYDSIDALMEETCKRKLSEDVNISNFFENDDEDSNEDIDYDAIESQAKAEMEDDTDVEGIEEESVNPLRKKAKYDVEKTASKTDDDEFDEFMNNCENGSFGDMVRGFIIDDSSPDTYEEVNDEVDEFISDENEDYEDEEAQPQNVAHKPSQIRSNKQTDEDITEYNDIDDLVTTNEIIDSKPKQTKPLSALAKEMNAFAESVKNGKIDLESAYGLGATETETISEEEKKRQMDAIRVRIGLK